MKIYNIHFHSVLFISGIVWSSGKMYLLEKRNEDPMSQTKSQVANAKVQRLRIESWDIPRRGPGCGGADRLFGCPGPGSRGIAASSPRVWRPHDLGHRARHLLAEHPPGHADVTRPQVSPDIGTRRPVSDALHDLDSSYSFTLSYGTFIQMENSKIKLKLLLQLSLMASFFASLCQNNI